MKTLTAISVSALLFAATGAFAEEHAATALEHANQAVTHGKAGHASVLVEHAQAALPHAKKARKLPKAKLKPISKPGSNLWKAR